MHGERQHNDIAALLQQLHGCRYMRPSLLKYQTTEIAHTCTVGPTLQSRAHTATQQHTVLPTQDYYSIIDKNRHTLPHLDSS